MLSGPQRTFCEGIVRGLSAGEAYRVAYPKSGAENARKNATRLMAKSEITAEIKAMRDKADLLGGSAVMDNLEKRIFCARVKRAQIALLGRDSDLWESMKVTEAGTEYRLPGKLAAIREDNNLAGEGAEAKALEVIVRRAWMTPA